MSPLLEPQFLIVQTLNGLQLSMLLFLLSIGLSVVFGLMNFINLAHGTLYMLGAYLALSAVRVFDSFWVALLLAPLGVALIGAVLYAVLLRRMQSQSPMRQVLVTFGLIFVGFDTVRMIWGLLPQTISAPPSLSGSVVILGEVYPTYRLFIIVLGLAVMLLLYFGLERTRLGAVVRAGVDDRMMVSALGVNVDRAFFGVFCLGCYLAGLAGVVSAPVFSIFPGMDMSILILTLIVVVLGGPGSLKGAALGSVIIGMADTYGQVVIPEFARVTIYALMAVILLFKPEGLMPVRRGH
jgi:branched-chain amino acid transport system permease protein